MRRYNDTVKGTRVDNFCKSIDDDGKALFADEMRQETAARYTPLLPRSVKSSSSCHFHLSNRTIDNP